MRKTLVRSLTGLAVTAACLASLEFCVRAGAAHYLHSRGWGESPAAAADPAAIRVLCVGDSFTFGFGAHPGRGYPDDLQRLVDAKYGRGRIAVINRGVPDLNSSQLAERLPDWLAQDRPSVVIVLIGWNNLKLFESSYFLFAPFYRGGWQGLLARADLLLRHSRLYSLARLEYLELRGRYRLARLGHDEAAHHLAEEGLAIHLRAIREARGQAAAELESQAEAKLRQALTGDSRQPLAHFLLGEILWSRRDPAARAEWVKAQSYDPEGRLGRDHLWEVQPDDPDAIDRPALQRAYAYDLDRIRREAAAAGAGLALQDYYTSQMPVAIPPYAQASGLCFIDNERFFDAVRRREGTVRPYLSSDGHLDDQGYVLMAGQVLEALERCKLLPRLAR